MIKVSVFTGTRPGRSQPTEVKKLKTGNALKEELVSRLFWQTRIDTIEAELLVIECPDTDPVEFVLFEGNEDDMESLLKVAEWYAMATLLCNESVWDMIKDEIEQDRQMPLAPISR